MQTRLTYLKCISLFVTFIIVIGWILIQKNYNDSLIVYDKEITYKQSFNYNKTTSQTIETAKPIYSIAIKKVNEKMAKKYHVSEETYQHLHVGDHVDKLFHRID